MSDLSDLARKRVAVAAYYFVPGLVFASWASRIPDVKHLLHLNNGQLGSILLAIPLGQLLMMGFAGMFCEGTVYDWSGVYFTSVVKPDEVFIRAGYVAGMGAMTLGRFLADGFVTRYGAAKVLKVCGLLILCGLLLATLLPYLVTATLGFLLVGFGISSSVPICYSIAGKLGTVKASIAITIVSSISFFGFLIGPPVIGWLAEAFNLRVALSIASLLGLTIVILSRRVKNRQ